MTRICFMGFNALKLLDPAPCRPFARDRRGMSLGEGAGFVVLGGRGACPGARGARATRSSPSYGLTTDAWHLTAPHPDGEGSVRAMAEALDRAGVPASAVGYINAHGTGTPQNDRVEAAALRKLFDPDAVLVSANKSLVGHAMAAAGALEAIATVLTLVHGLVPPTANLDDPDPEWSSTASRTWRVPRRLECAMSNSFGFGGQNLSLLFRRVGGLRGAWMAPARAAGAPRPRVVVTGMGSVSALGVGGGAAAGRSARARRCSRIGPVRAFPTERCWSRLGGEVGDVTPYLQDGEGRRLARASQLARRRGPTGPERCGAPGGPAGGGGARARIALGGLPFLGEPSRSGSSSAAPSGSRRSSFRTP